MSFEGAELAMPQKAGIFEKEELEILQTAAKTFTNSEERKSIALELYNEINAMPLAKRNSVLQKMEDKLNPKDPLDQVNKELSLVPEGVSCVHNADKNVVAATVNGYEMVFNVPGRDKQLPFNREQEAQRVIEIARQNTGDHRQHDFGPANFTEAKALKLALADELNALSAPQKNSLLNFMQDKYSPTDVLDRNRREQAGIPLGVELFKPSPDMISSATINGISLAIEEPSQQKGPKA